MFRECPLHEPPDQPPIQDPPSWSPPSEITKLGTISWVERPCSSFKNTDADYLKMQSKLMVNVRLIW